MKSNFIEEKTYSPAPATFVSARRARTPARTAGVPGLSVCTPARDVRAPARGVGAPARGVHAPGRGTCAPARFVCAPAQGACASAIGIYPLETVILARNLRECHIGTPRLLFLNDGDGPPVEMGMPKPGAKKMDYRKQETKKNQI